MAALGRGQDVIALRRRTREAFRHDRAVVLQELGAQAASDPRPDWERNKTRSAELRAWVTRREEGR